MKPVTNENFHLFLEGKTDIIQFVWSSCDYHRWKYIAPDPTYIEAYIIAMDMKTREIKTLYVKKILEQSQDYPVFFIDATFADIYNRLIEYHEKHIETIKERLAKEEKK